jgi:hypothetical protein
MKVYTPWLEHVQFFWGISKGTRYFSKLLNSPCLLGYFELPPEAHKIQVELSTSRTKQSQAFLVSKSYHEPLRLLSDPYKIANLSVQMRYLLSTIEKDLTMTPQGRVVYVKVWYEVEETHDSGRS